MRRDVSSGVGSKRRSRICSIVESGREERLEAGGRDIFSVDVYQRSKDRLISRRKAFHTFQGFRDPRTFSCDWFRC